MDNIIGLDFLTNTGSQDTAKSIDLGVIESVPEPPRLVPDLGESGPIETSMGLRNFNAPIFTPSSYTRSDEFILREKYEILRKFERLTKIGVPLRKKFNLDSPIEEMRTELDSIKREKAMDSSIKQFCDWYITGMSSLEWSTTNVPFMRAFGLNLTGLSDTAQMNNGNMEEDFEELYELYGDKLKIHPLVRIPIKICSTVYMVNLTNKMIEKSTIPNIDQILKTNPDIAKQLASAAMQQQTTTMKSQPSNTFQYFMNSNTPPPPQPPQQQKTQGNGSFNDFLSSIIPPPPPAQSTMKPVQLTPKGIKPKQEMAKPMNIDELLKSAETSKPKKSGGGSTGKNSVNIKL
jgi:hypothetical protein